MFWRQEGSEMGVCGWVYSRIHTFDWLVSFCCLIDGKWTMGGGACSYNGVLVYSSVFFFSCFFFFFFFCLWRQYKQRLQLSTNEKAGSVAWRCSAKVSQPKKPKKTTKNTKLREKIKEINLKTRKITLPDPETFFSFFFFPFFFFL